jgi:DNA polymerase-1
MSDKTLLLVDGSSYLYRAFHALPDLRSPSGFPTGAIHGVVAMMKKLRDDYPALHGACVFDDKGTTFRDEWYPEYKATRKQMPPDLALQIEPIHEAVKLLGWPGRRVPGIEADDAIGTISCMAAKGGFDVVISTGDKDLAQLVGERVTLINTMSNERLDVAAVTEKFGVPPERIIDYLALIGDSVDNIPGVEKVGPKTAARWIAEHGSLEGVMAAATGMKGVAGENLRKALDWLPQGRRLVTVVTDCDLTGHVLGWPEFDALALGAIDATACWRSTSYGFKVAAPRARGEHRRKIAPPAGDSAAAGAGDSGRDDREALRDGADGEGSTLIAHQRAFDRARHRDRQPRRGARRPSACRHDRCRPGLPHPAASRLRRRPGSSRSTRWRLKPWLENPRAAGRPQHQVRHPCVRRRGITLRAAHDTLLQSYVLEGTGRTLEPRVPAPGRTGLTYERPARREPDRSRRSSSSGHRPFVRGQRDGAARARSALAADPSSSRACSTPTGASRCRRPRSSADRAPAC